MIVLGHNYLFPLTLVSNFLPIQACTPASFCQDVFVGTNGVHHDSGDVFARTGNTLTLINELLSLQSAC